MALTKIPQVMESNQTQSRKNYFSSSNANGDFELGVASPWSAFTTVYSASVPTTITLTSTQTTLTTVSVTPLSGTTSGQFSKSAANAVGQGFISSVLTIDRTDLAKVLFGQFSYEPISGTIDFSGSSTSSFEIWIYNVTAATWIQPSGYRGLTQGSGPSRVSYSFQTDSTAANNQYRIAIILPQTDTNAMVVNFDEFQLGPQTLTTGAAMTDWQSYTPTISNMGTGSATAIGKYRRVGDSVQLMVAATKDASAGTGATQVTFSLPSGLTYDSSKSTSTNGGNTYGFGNLTFGASALALAAVAGSGNTIGLLKTNGNSVFSGSDFPASQVVNFEATVPIVGWSSNVQQSSDSLQQVVAARAVINSTVTSTSTASTVIFGGVTYDTTGSYNPSTGIFTCPVTGKYRVTARIDGNALAATASYCNVNLWKNGSPYAELYTSYGNGTVLPRLSGTDEVDCKAGDTLTIVVATAVSSTLSTGNNVIFERLSGSAVVQATETVACEYGLTTAQVVTVDTPIKYDTLIGDSHSMYSVSTGLVTVPISGRFRISTVGNTTTAQCSLYIKRIRGGSSVNVTYVGSAGTSFTAGGSVTIPLLAGDQIAIQPDSPQTFAGISGRGFVNILSIERVGN